MDEEIRMTGSRNRDNVQVKGNCQTEKREIKNFREPAFSPYGSQARRRRTAMFGHAKKMKTWVPIVCGMVAGVACAIIELNLNMIGLEAFLHPFFRQVCYRHQDPIAGLVFDPALTVILCALIGGTAGLIVGIACKRKKRH